jgi:hypothetical protein
MAEFFSHASEFSSHVFAAHASSNDPHEYAHLSHVHPITWYGEFVCARIECKYQRDECKYQRDE